MTTDPAAVAVRVIGPADLLITSVVSALRATGYDAERLPGTDVPPPPGEPWRHGPAVLLADLDTGNVAGVVAQALAEGWTVIALGGDAAPDRIAAAVAAGVAGRVPKGATVDALAAAVKDAVAGRTLIEPGERAEWLQRYRAHRDAVADQTRRLDRLSRREREVLRHLADGRRAAEVAELLYLSITTVRTHIRAVLGKLGVNSQEDAVTVYRQFLRHLPPERPE